MATSPKVDVAQWISMTDDSMISVNLKSIQRAQVVNVLRAHQADIKRFGVRLLALFGSTARDEATVESDVEILVEFAGPAAFDNCCYSCRVTGTSVSTAR